MFRVIKIIDPECNVCMGASYNPNDCAECDRKFSEVTLCMNCKHRNESIMHQEKLLCKKLHAWVEPCDFCAWGKNK